MLYSDGDECSVEVAPSSNSQPSNHELSNYDCDTIELQGWTQFKRCLMERAARFLHDPEVQYVAVKNVSTSDMEHIDYLRGRGDLPQMRILYDEDERVMIVKLMPGLPHEVASGAFFALFCEKVPFSSGISPVMSTRFGEANRRHKEPDLAFLQRSTRFPNPDWPSLVVEVGASESLKRLQEDAHYWLINSQGQVLVVILISIDLTTRGVRWERWQHVPTVGRVTRSHPRIHPTLMQFVSLPRGGPVVGAPFRIPINKIWDVVPANIGVEIQFSAQELETFSRTLVECSR